MEWKSLFIGLLIGALIALPFGMAHSGGFDIAERTGMRWGSGPADHPGPGMMGYGMMNGYMYQEHEEMAEYLARGNFAEMHDEMEEEMEEHMGSNWIQMHEYCERAMGIEEDE